ncbi:MAG: endo-1,4-beta-xylanase [Prevotella sp.]|nr:endo-1,4-beta-xylanase [Prevotella sp.]
MKLHRIILPAVASVMLLTGCDDQIMEWFTPEGHGTVTKAELPLQVKEVLANYDNIKDYASQYMPNTVIGLGIGGAIYASDDARHQLADNNFQMITWGNAMKHDAMMSNSGTLNTASLDTYLDAMPAGMQLYGHNFFWHTQQNQTYLRSLIVPSVEIIQDASENVENIVANSDFEAGNTSGWGAWSSAGCKQEISDKGEGFESDYAIRLYNPAAGANYSAQAFYKLPAVTYEEGETYVLSFYVMGDHIDTQFQAQLQNRNTYSAKKYLGSPINKAGEWTYYEHEFEMTADIINSAFDHITFDFGAATGYVWIDNVKFGKKKTGPTNYAENGSFENGTNGWTFNNPGAGVEVVELDDAIDGSHALKLTAKDDSKNYWDLQITTAGMPTFPGEKVRIAFFIKSSQVGKGRVSYPSGDEITNQWPWVNWTGKQSSWTESFETSTSWTEINYVMQNMSHDFKDGATTWHFCIDLGTEPGVTYYVDDVRVTLLSEEGESTSSKQKAAPRRVQMKYTPKTAEEKDAILTDAMESWISSMADYLNGKGITPYGYDVINEAIADGSNKVRGVDNVFGGNDTEPVETESDITLNWDNGHFYWGYYVKDYGVKAFQFARKYFPNTKLFINDYNLETSPGKLAALIDWVKSIDAANGTPIVDGIGTQMHIAINPTDNADDNATIIANLKEKVDAQFKTLAATGKLVRVTELDVDMCGYEDGERSPIKSPSAAQYKCQADVYRMIFESYKANVPAAQQSGITIWSLTDQADEHEYWLEGGQPNLFDANNLRKWAYKGVCDGIAGEDLGLKYGGEDYKAFYEKQNVSDTVK